MVVSRQFINELLDVLKIAATEKLLHTQLRILKWPHCPASLLTMDTGPPPSKIKFPDVLFKLNFGPDPAKSESVKHTMSCVF